MPVTTKDTQNFEQYEVMFTKGVQQETKSKLRPPPKRTEKKSKSFVKNVSEAGPSNKISQKSREKMQMLGPRIVKEGERICFKCLQKHDIRDCELYKDVPLTDRLCFKQEGNKRRPCGFHFGSCKNQNKRFSNIKIDGNVKGDRASPSVWRVNK